MKHVAKSLKIRVAHSDAKNRDVSRELAMKLGFMLLLVLLMSSGCIKYKKALPAGSSEGAESEASVEESHADAFSGSDETATDEESIAMDAIALSDHFLATIASNSKSQAFEAEVNLNGRHSKAKKVEILKDEAHITISDLPAINSGQMKLEIFSDKDLKFSIRLSNVTTTTSKDLRVVLNNCRPKAKSDAKDKEVVCNWSAEQAMQ